MIFVIKVMTNKEDRAMDMIAEKVQKKQLQVFSLARPHGLRGYIFLEAVDRESAEEMGRLGWGHAPGGSRFPISPVSRAPAPLS